MVRKEVNIVSEIGGWFSMAVFVMVLEIIVIFVVLIAGILMLFINIKEGIFESKKNKNLRGKDGMQRRSFTDWWKENHHGKR
jgi:uncharacterized membrane protein